MKPIHVTPLDNPAWSALTSLQAHLAQGDDFARRFRPAVAPFAAVGSLTGEAMKRLANLLAPGESAFLLALSDISSLACAAGLRVDKLFDVLQMVDEGVSESDGLPDAYPLDWADVDAMSRLARATNPGPFLPCTIETGHYIGVRENGRLIAMAGERMRMNGFVEISAVCVDSEHRGKGIAACLMSTLRTNIRNDGNVPFLHVRTDNASAIGLYERLGFEHRQTFHLCQVTRGEGR